MKCLRCGYCCIHYDVMIVDDPKLGIIESNIIRKPTGIKCKHLFSDDTLYNCSIHNESWYKETPCFQHTQIESSNDSNCRIGNYILNKV